MGSATTKGYPYPVGTDRVMDGDDAIKALAEAVDSDANYSRALATGQSVALSTNVPVSWNAANPNGCALTKTNANTWTITKAGIYVLTAVVNVANFQTTGNRAYVGWWLNDAQVQRATFATENTGYATIMHALVAGDALRVEVFVTGTATSVQTTSFLNVARLGRT